MSGCFYCGTTDDLLRPYGPGGAPLCFPCLKSTPEREAQAGAAFGALLDANAAMSPTGAVVLNDPELRPLLPDEPLAKVYTRPASSGDGGAPTRCEYLPGTIGALTHCQHWHDAEDGDVTACCWCGSTEDDSGSCPGPAPVPEEGPDRRDALIERMDRTIANLRDRLKAERSDMVPAEWVASLLPGWRDAEKANGWVNFHPEPFCHNCGGRNITSWGTTAEEWNRTDCQSIGGGIVCPQCLTRKADAAVETRTGFRSWALTPDLLSWVDNPPAATPEPGRDEK